MNIRKQLRTESSPLRCTIAAVLGGLTGLACYFVATAAMGGMIYQYEGPDFSAAAGRFSTSDSITAEIEINNPPLGGTCYDRGAGAGQCDITAMSFTASGSPPLTLDLNSPDLVIPSAMGEFLTFDTNGNLVEWTIGLSQSTGGLDSVHTISSGGSFGTIATSMFGASIGVSTGPDGPGSWQLIPETKSLALMMLAVSVYTLCGGKMYVPRNTEVGKDALGHHLLRQGTG